MKIIETPETSISQLRAALEKVTEMVTLLSNAVENSKKGEPVTPSQIAELSLELSSTAIRDIGTVATKLGTHFTLEAHNSYLNDCRNEWLSNGMKFTPKTAMELDLWNDFHTHKQDGYSVLVFYSDSLRDTYPIIPVGKGANTEHAIEEIKSLNMTKIMAVLDLHKSFDEQWPYIPGAIHAPLQLMENPVISIPQLENSKRHRNAPHLRCV